MNEHIASSLAGAALHPLKGDPPAVHPRSHPRSMTFPYDIGTLCKMNPLEAQGEVKWFLKRRGERRYRKPQPKRIALEKCPTWNGSIINLTPVAGGPGRAQ